MLYLRGLWSPSRLIDWLVNMLFSRQIVIGWTVTGVTFKINSKFRNGPTQCTMVVLTYLHFMNIYLESAPNYLTTHQRSH